MSDTFLTLKPHVANLTQPVLKGCSKAGLLISKANLTVNFE